MSASFDKRVLSAVEALGGGYAHELCDYIAVRRPWWRRWLPMSAGAVSVALLRLEVDGLIQSEWHGVTNRRRRYLRRR